MRLTLLLSILGLIGMGQAGAFRYSGGDISLLSEYDEAIYYSPDGKRVADFLTYCADEGMNAMRVRLFVAPEKYTGSDKDANACQDLDYIIPICKRIQNAGCKLVLDFHYSDTWADPQKQWTPADWTGLSDSDLCTKIYTYTKESLQTLAANGIVPDLIQTGNEISYGMLWGAYGSSSTKRVHVSSDSNWERFGNLLKNAVKACREECPNAGIIIHTERVPQPWYIEGFYNRLNLMGVDYDIIGLSYYPYYHGNLDTLETAISSCETNFPNKKVMIVETGYSYAWEMTENPVSQDYELTPEGQNEFSRDLVALLDRHPAVNGLFWWWMEYNPNGIGLSGWYNAPLVDCRNGKISPALSTIAGFADNTPDETEDPKEEDSYPDFYVVYNNNAGWKYPGALMSSNGEGTYTIRNLYISDAAGEYGWFTLGTSSNSWTDLEAHRYGPESDSTVPEEGIPSTVVKDNHTSWQVSAGYYTIVFDYNAMTLTAEKTGGWTLELSAELPAQTGQINHDSKEITVFLKSGNEAILHVHAPYGVSKVFGMITPATGAGLKAAGSYSELTDRTPEGAYSLTIPEGNGTLSLYYDSNYDNPEVFAYSVTKEDSTGVGAVEEGDSEIPVYYNLQGVRVSEPRGGIFIRVAAGRPEKVAIP